MSEQIEIDSGKKGITLFVVIAMTFMATLDSSIVNVAMPVMSGKMNVPLSSIEWVVASYSIIICATLLFLDGWEISSANQEFFSAERFYSLPVPCFADCVTHSYL